MMPPRRLRAVLIALAAATILSVPAQAHHKAGHGTTTTTVAPTTTTVVPTTTTVAPTTTTTAPPSCSPGTPITITVGGTYSGCYQSTDPATNAVTIATTQPVVIDNAEVRHKGIGVDWGSQSGTNLTITDTIFTALDHGGVPSTEQFAVFLFRPASLVIEHNQFTDGGGVRVQNNGTTTSGPLRLRFNDFQNVGRWGLSQFEVSAVHFNTVVAAAEIGWNRVFNASPETSSVLDVMNLFGSSGLSAAQPIDMHHNMVRGAYDRWNPSGSNYVGGGLMGGDDGGGFQVIRDNRIVGTSNYGCSIPGGHDVVCLRNRIVNDGKTEAGVPHGPSYAVGIAVWNANSTHPTGPNTYAQDNVVGWLKPDGSRSDTWLPSCDPACTGNTALADPITLASELAEWNAWQADANAAGVTVGPRP